MGAKYQGKPFEEFEPGEEWNSGERTVSEDEVMSFATLTGDLNPFHTDAEFAREGPYKERIAHGLYVTGVLSGFIYQIGFYNGTAEALSQVNFRFIRPVFFGDKLRVRIRVQGKRELPGSSSRGLVTFEARIRNQHGKTVVTGQWDAVVRKKNAGAG